jgi:hypothetical protein
MTTTIGLRRRLRRLERRRYPAGGRVRCVWWRRGAPRPEAAPGERLHVHRWVDHADGGGEGGGDGGTPAPSPPGAARWAST